MKITNAIERALNMGFTYAVELDADTIELLPEVRRMCGANTCGKYGKNWSCPPACGELDALQKTVSRFHRGILVQTVGDVEDSMDYEAMIEVEAIHKKHFLELKQKLSEDFPDSVALGTGCCTICKVCAYPDEKCRFPEQKISSLEAYGILVSDLCKRNNLAYYYGAGKIAYTSCYLLL